MPVTVSRRSCSSIGIACNRAFPAPLARFLKASHWVVAVDLRGHGDSDAPRQRYTIGTLADDVAWMCERLDIGV
jgi:pimeloyl-ACP methyl ester carboxylesterase